MAKLPTNKSEFPAIFQLCSLEIFLKQLLNLHELKFQIVNKRKYIDTRNNYHRLDHPFQKIIAGK